MLKVQVTADDIREGKREDSLHCPIALALQRLLGQPWRVGTNVAQGPNWGESADLPPAAREFVLRFDLGLPVEPFEFETQLD